MGITERKERVRQEMKQHILDAAKELFLSEGFENVSIRRIAQKIEYSPTTVYIYFKDKEEILLALHDEGFRKLLRRFENVDTIADPLERLRAIGQEYINFAFENVEYYELMYITHPLGRLIDNCEDSDMVAQVHKILFRAVDDCIKAGHMKDVDVHTAAFTCWATLHGAIAIIIRNGCPTFFGEDAEELVKKTLEFAMSTYARR